MFFHSFIYRKRNFLLLFFISVSSFSQQIGDGVATHITDFSLPLNSGLYQGVSPIGTTPDLSHPWQHLFVLRHTNPSNNHQLQIGASYNTNDRLFFRKIAAGLQSSNPDWIEIATRGSNNFTGDQTVNGNINLAGASGRRIFMGGAGGSTFGLAYDSTYPNYGIFYTEGNPDFVSISPNGNATNGVMNILGNGNVGIGTSNPLAKLDINGVIQTYNKYNDGATWDNVRMWAEGENSYIEANGDENGLIIRSNTGNKILLMSNVGIGTTTPDSKLTVNGNIHAKEVKIDLSVPAPDYVFAPDYKLRTLEEVESFIKENSHLPEIPSAREIEKNGLMLAEMNMLLLKKMEEMTLYMIDFKKEINVLKDENRAQQEEISKLKKAKK